MPWTKVLKCDGSWLCDHLPGSQNKLWEFGKREFESGHFETLAALTEWVDQAKFHSNDIGSPHEQTMFGQLATGMAYGFAALGEWKQGQAQTCLDHLSHAANAYQQATTPNDTTVVVPDFAGVALTHVGHTDEFLRRGLAAVEAACPTGGGMLRTLLAQLVPGLQEAPTWTVRLRVLLDATVRTGEMPVLHLQLHPAHDQQRAWSADPVRLGCTLLDQKFLDALDCAWKLTKDQLPRSCRITWGLEMTHESRHLGGPSAGAVFAAGLLGLARELEFDTGVAMTAAINTQGELHSVGSVPQKIQKATQQGVRQFVLCPEDSGKHRDKLQTDCPGITILTASHVEDTLEHLTGQAREVRLFLEKLIDQGLLQNVRQKPRHVVTGKDIEAFCLRPRVVDADRWEQLKKHREDNAKSGARAPTRDDADYIMPSHEEYLRSGGEHSVTPHDLTPPKDSRQILEGEPGEGKTTALWLMVADQCRELLKCQTAGEPVTTAAGYRVPLAVPLGTIDETRRQQSLLQIARDHVLQMVRLPQRDEENLKQWLDKKIQDNEYTLYLDALDELPQGERGQRWLWQELDSLDVNVPLLLTTRTSVAQQARIRIRNPRRFRMVCFGHRQIGDFVKRYFREEQDLARELMNRQRMSPGPRQLMQLPLLLGLLCELKQSYPKEELPKTRTELLKKGLHQLFRRGDARRKTEYSPSDHDEKEQVLRHVAWRFHEAQPVSMPQRKLLKEIRENLPEFRKDIPGRPDEALLTEFVTDGILVLTGTETYRFVLRSFHEYCLAGWIANEAPFCKDPDHFLQVVTGDANAWARTDWGELNPLDEESWKHIWPIVAGQMKERGGWLLGTWRTRIDPANWHFDLQVVAQCVTEVGLHHNEARELLKCFCNRLEDREENANVRKHCATCLGHIGGPEAVDVLRVRLEDRDEDAIDLRNRCADALSMIGSPEALTVLRRRILDPDENPDVSSTCAWAMSQIDGPEAVSVLRAILENQNQNFAVRHSCALGLGRLGGPDVVAVLRLRLVDEDEEEEVRNSCALSLGRLGGSDVVAVLRLRLEDEDEEEEVRNVCAWALGNIHCSESVAILRARLMDRDEEVEIRCGCALGLGRIGSPEAFAILQAHLEDRDEDQRVRRQCAGALSNFGSSEAFAVLQACFEDPGEAADVRGTCAEGLCEMDGSGAIAALRARLEDRNEDSAIRSGCVRVLTDIDDPEALDVLRTRLDDRRDEVEIRCGCALGLARFGGPDDVSVLWARLKDKGETSFVGIACARALGKIGDHSSREALLSCLHNPELHDVVREWCAWAFGEIGDKASREALLNRLDNPEVAHDVRGWCARALGKIGDEASREAMLRSLDDPNTPDNVRIMSAQAIDDIDDEH